MSTAVPSEGDFSFIQCPLERKRLADAYAVIGENPKFRHEIISFKPPMNSVYNFGLNDVLGIELPLLLKEKHTGNSFAETMRHMQYIFQKGWAIYTKLMTSEFSDVILLRKPSKSNYV